MRQTTVHIWYTEAKPNPSRGNKSIPWEELIPQVERRGYFMIFLDMGIPFL
jgi:hypothetical protein